jgi:two-component system, OmpR family, response regulator
MESLILKGRRLLVVDDDRDSRDLLVIALQAHGAEVVAVSAAKEALTMLQQQPHLLISDIKMPDIDGYALIRQLRALEVQDEMLPAIAVTACASQDDRANVLKAGFQAYLTKPVDLDELLVVIVSLLTAAQPSQQVEAS